MTSKINIELTADQYKSLLKLVGIGSWVMSCNESGDLSHLKSFEDAEQILFSKANDASCSHLIRQDEEGKYWETSEFEEGSDGFMQYVDAYDNESFWQNLIDRLAMRDAKDELGSKLAKLDLPDRFEKLQFYEDKYISEFEKNGLENLHISQPTH